MKRKHGVSFGSTVVRQLTEAEMSQVNGGATASVTCTFRSTPRGTVRKCTVDGQ